MQASVTAAAKYLCATKGFGRDTGLFPPESCENPVTGTNQQ
jgi:hypothetical protein